MKQIFRKKSITQIQQEIENIGDEHSLNKNLRLRDLVSFGIAAVVGAGIFSTIGNAAFNGGPGVVFLFMFTAVACLFSALCYAEFASTIPISGSAYTYAYTTFGELIAWILGWALVMEYAIGNIAVAISWSDYFTGLVNGIGSKLGFQIPEYFCMDYLSASRGFEKAKELLSQGQVFKDLPDNIKEAFLAWQNAPQINGFRLIADLPALLVTILITSLVYVGIKESKNAGNIMVIIKLVVIFLVIIVGFYYVNPENWSPFAPNGLTGILKGTSAVFFAYIGFDAISTTAEECKNPQRDLPRAMIYSLIICTIIYVILALVLTGMTSYKNLQVGDPLAYVFEVNQLDFMAGLVAVSAVITITSVFLVFQLGQPRILMTMSRDGLLPQAFGKIHPKYKTPYISTIATGLLVAIPALFLNLTEVTDLTSIGTLFAFTLVSGGVLLLEDKDKQVKNRFKVPYINGKILMPLLLGSVFSLSFYYSQEETIDFFTFSQYRTTTKANVELVNEKNKIQELKLSIKNKKDEQKIAVLETKFQTKLNELNKEKSKSNLEIFFKRIPLYCFTIFCLVLVYLTFRYNLSLIPVLGLLTNFYLMTELGINNWIGFGIWMLIGLSVYLLYGYKNSKLRIR